MSKKSLIIAVIIILITALALFLIQKSGTSGDEKQEELQTFTSEQISQHNTKQDCWLVIHNNVYDVTNWIPIHPGRDAILEGCGKDATQLFETRQMGSETPHSQTARNGLKTYLIGKLDENGA